MMAVSPWWTILAIALPPVPALAASPADPYQLDVKVAPGEGAKLTADANLKAEFPSLQTGLRFVVEADPGLVSTDPLSAGAITAAHRETLNLNAAWAIPAGVKLELKAADTLGQSWNPLTLGLTPASDHQILTDNRVASVGVAFTPARAVDFNLTGATAQNSVLDTVIAENSGSRTRSQLITATQSATAALKWRPTSWFTLDASGRVETTNAQWRGGQAGASLTGADLTYGYFEPSVTGALAIPTHGRLGMTFEHAVSPLDAQAFATYAAVGDRGDSARFGPNREWRYRLKLEQPLLWRSTLTAALVQARIESATELGPAGPVTQAPVSVTGGARQEFDLSLTAPLAAIGLPTVTLKGSGAWRSSHVRDPFTGDLRQASAETPQAGSVGIVQTLDSGRARWGIEGHFSGDQNLYQMSQITTVTVSDSVGGFIEYAPGSFAVRLQIDGLYGGDRAYTDTIYNGVRGANGYIDRIDRRTDSGQAVRLFLRKAL
ncbi:MAG: hypothetical protein P4L64_03835 [Caulobacteraceae bacterium]|nr:hypothetical protein [Caulobacteraceae bacterium]